jgi:hypothetical protein
MGAWWAFPRRRDEVRAGFTCRPMTAQQLIQRVGKRLPVAPAQRRQRASKLPPEGPAYRVTRRGRAA